MNPSNLTSSGHQGRKRLGRWICLSVALNLAFLAILTRPALSPSSRHALPDRPLRPELSSDATIHPIGPLPSSIPQATDPWQALKAGDYAGAISLLRAAHCPEETIQDILALRMSGNIHAAVMEQIQQRERLRPWWRCDIVKENREMRRDVATAQAQLARDFQSLFGVTYETAVAEFFPWRKPEDPNPIQPEHQEAYDALLARHREERDALYDQAPFHGSMLDSRQTKELMALQTRQQMEIQSLLNPAELEALELRNSPASQAARKYLPEAQSEGQFREMVRVAKSMGLSPDIPMLPGEDPEKWSQREDQLTAEYRQRMEQILGRETLDQLTRAQEERSRRYEEQELARSKPRP